MSEGFAAVNGPQLWYEVAGSGPPVVMLHGHLIDSGQWDTQMVPFGREFEVVGYDAGGFGRSDQPDGALSFSEDLHALVRFLGIERAALMGSSGGGATVIDFTLAHPAAADALVLVGSAVSGYRFSGDPAPKVVEHQQALESGDLERAVELALQIWTGR